MAENAQPVRRQPELKQYPQYDHSSRECFLNLERTHVIVRPFFERLFRQHGLSGSSFNVLSILRRAASPLAPREIGERVVVSRPTVTGLLETLESRGLVRRDTDPSDGRRRRVALTKAGDQLVETLLPDVFALQVEMFTGLTAVEKETLIQLLGRIQATMIGVSNKKVSEPVKQARSGPSKSRRDNAGRAKRRQTPDASVVM